MKKIILSLLSIALFSAYSFGQTADEIIEKNTKAMGGIEKLKSINSVVMEGKVNAQGMEIPIKMIIVKNIGSKVEFSVMGMNAWTIMRPDSGWMFMPFQGQTKPEAMPADAIKEGTDMLDLEGELVNYKEKGHSIEYLGMDDVEGTECHKLKIITKNGNVHYELIDPKSFLTVRKIAINKSGGKEMEIQTDLSNYKEVEGGFMFPFTVSSMGGPMEMTKILINSPVDNSAFRPTN
ncbi:MAG: hypothetical protein ABIO44_12565 [Saprospiraceae bacterium]